MKTVKILIMVVLLISLGSCREITVKTRVNEDGSFTRTMTITGDSNDVLNPDLPYPVDETWTKTLVKDTSEGGDFILTYTKAYKGSELLNGEISRDTGWRNKISREITIKKRWWFFNSYLRFRETWKAANPFNMLDYRDYISEHDLLWLSGYQLASSRADSLLVEEAEDKVEIFLQESVTREIMEELRKGLGALNLSGEAPDDIFLYHDSIMAKVREWDFETTAVFIDYYASWADDLRLLGLHDVEPPLFAALDEDIKLLEKILMMESYQSLVEMPGLITNTNSPAINGNQVSWKVSGNSFLFEDYEMVVESRIINTWAYVVAGILLLAFIALLVIKARR